MSDPAPTPDKSIEDGASANGEMFSQVLTQVHHQKIQKAHPKGFTPTKKNLPVPHLPN